jgi:hypothetical protein
MSVKYAVPDRDPEEALLREHEPNDVETVPKYLGSDNSKSQ